MANTTNFNLTLLEIGQKNKETTINTNMELLDQKIPRYIGELSSDPTASGVSSGSTYFNTSTSKLKVLKTNGTWVNAA